MPKRTEDQAVAMKANKQLMYDVACSMRAAAREVLNGLHFDRDTYEFQGSAKSINWLEDACKEWENLVDRTKKELGIC
jgi:hypothetical protein